MDNASIILQTLDRHLDHPVRLILYGRAALQLGFDNPPTGTAQSRDVDGIVPFSDLEALTRDDGFWNAQEATNAELAPQGLYIAHLFRADQVFLRRDWEAYLLPVTRPSVRWLRLFRPATLDLVLTKMMRGEDALDMDDITFLVRHDRLTLGELDLAINEVFLPDLPELRDEFEKARPRVREMARGGPGSR